MMRSILTLLLLLMLGQTAKAGDGWQGRPSVCDHIPSGPRAERCHQWVQTAQRPDIPGASCCGEADAFMADDFELGPNGELYAIITADYPDTALTTFDNEGNAIPAPPNDFKVRRGMKILIPPDRLITRPEDANRSGHGVVYLRPSNGEVLCYAMPPLT